MTPNKSLSIKDIANALKGEVPDGTSGSKPAIMSAVPDRDIGDDNIEINDEEPIINGAKDFSALGNPELFITNVKKWKMTSETKLMEVDVFIISFFGNLKAITNIPAKKFINYLLAYYLAGNPELEKYVHAKMRANAPSKHFRNL
ncbi:hypothetical protein V9K67_21785 [Paraflavisolibacter sp. H34]|uniref:hypothetical protein n=1 Tax=Huijunlia imazamoxiresistens TaxID=3127457 RepID=UPI003017DEEF